LKTKITLLPVAYDISKAPLDPKRNVLLVDEQPLFRYMANEQPQEVLRKICEEYIGYAYSWLKFELGDFLRHSDHFEVVYYCSFPNMLGWNKKGTILHMSIDEELQQIGEHYFDTLSRFTSRRYG
jgi:hypothetical protein